jgi:hypothetical protein
MGVFFIWMEDGILGDSVPMPSKLDAASFGAAMPGMCGKLMQTIFLIVYQYYMYYMVIS